MLDTAFLSHALVATQQTEAATQGLHSLLRDVEHRIVPGHVVLEFGSLLRKTVNQRRLSALRADEAFMFVARLGEIVTPPDDILVHGYELAARLGQSDTFDATGYAMAEALGAEFWTSDRRFTNAARAAGLGSIRLFG